MLCSNMFSLQEINIPNVTCTCPTYVNMSCSTRTREWSHECVPSTRYRKIQCTYSCPSRLSHHNY